MPRFRVVLDVWTDDVGVTEDDITDVTTELTGMLAVIGPIPGLSVDVDEVTAVDSDAV